MNWPGEQWTDPIMSDTEMNIVHFTHPIELAAVAGRGEGVEWSLVLISL